MSSANVIKDVFIPADKQQRDIILRIQREVADSPFMEIYQMHFIPETFVLYTTVLKFMEGIKRTLFRNDKQFISIGDMITIEKSTRTRETAEKTGNINCIIKLGPVGESILNKGIDGFVDVLENDKKMMADMSYAQTIAQKELEHYRFGYRIEGMEIYQMVMIFFVHTILIVKEYAENANIDEKEFMLNIGTYFAIRFHRHDNTYDLHFVPGETMKKSVKSDGYTEG